MSSVEIFPWNTYFEVGVDETDKQHRKLVEIINEICSCALSTKNYEETIDDLFVKLIDYSKYHFDWEEQYYQDNNLPGELFDAHQGNHGKLIAQILSLKTKYDQDVNKDTNLEEILTTLVLWLTHHILEDDMLMCLIIDNLAKGMQPAVAIKNANRGMKGPKGTIAKVMSSMMNVSSSSVLELRREITFRKELEGKLNSEILIRKEAERKLTYLAQHDALTELPNRRLFEELGDVAIKGAKRSKAEQAILFVDIDGFKAINDTLGHQAGDELLIAIARRLEDGVRESDIVARIGGDEFILHLGGECGQKDACAIAEKIIKAMATPFDLEDGTANVGASVGIALYPGDAADVKALVQNADAAMYVAKKSGKNAYKLFSEI